MTAATNLHPAANASSKRIASSNEKALSNLLLGLLSVNSSSLLIRVLFKLIRSTPIYASKKLFTLHLISLGATVAVWRWFSLVGTPGRDSKGNVRSGEDLAGGGVIELAWDLVYITWLCTLGSALFGSWVWYFYLLIPAFGGYKLFTFARPFLGMFLPGLFGPKSASGAPAAGPAAPEEQSESKRQAKLRARAEKGDKRIQQQEVRRAR
ncbi:uncharacterized protein MKK02DRAFT_42403 [Dioszegia hungarica]|uniref:DUF788-domain-containing protein n=1 Tax=Dioszegia hungarica TaxID=4972 RepID=A0AA38HFN3_9TREE|nr:uncharacterized protein MKK02DRAFT_42403 [Dioszegia hungarica]KAI9638019.1 hypothetical protein MKK02DRAFT_42403 [Dioszegia hungarica]